MAENKARRGQEIQYTGIGVGIGAGVGATIGVLIGGGAGIALGLCFGAGLGVAIGAAMDARQARTRSSNPRTNRSRLRDAVPVASVLLPGTVPTVSVNRTGKETRMTSGPIGRASAIDIMEFATATTPAAGQVGAVLVLASVRPLDLDVVRSTLADRITAVPRLRQRLCRVPLGCGRPIWVDDASFDIANHVKEVRSPLPGDRSALFIVAADLVARRLPPDRPLWSASLVTGLAEDATALVLIFHHVMADGIGGLAVLANLVDGAPISVTGDFPRAAPSRTGLFADAMRSRVHSVAHLRDGIRRVRDAAAELGAGARMARAPRCSLNRPVGPRRCLAVVRTSLDAVHAAARQHGASVNDAVLAAITGALAQFLHDRHEEVDHFVVSIPISGREAATAAQLGNEVGIMPVTLPATGTASARMEAIAAITRAGSRRLARPPSPSSPRPSASSPRPEP